MTNELNNLEGLPAFLDKLVESHPWLSSGVHLAIDVISCSSTFLNAYEIKESGDSSMFLVNLQPLHPDTKYQPLFSISLTRGNGPYAQGLFDQIMTKVKTQIPVPGLSFEGDLSYNFRHEDFAFRGSTTTIKRGKS
jgi:hypothetical protein